MKLRPPQFLLSVVLLAVPLVNELKAQTTTSGGLTGVVTDQSGAVVPDAPVELKDNAKGTSQSTKTDREGVYQFFFLSPGRYVLTVTHVGFRKETRAVNVLLGPPVSANVKLTVATANTNITVQGEAPLLQAENGDASATMNQVQVSELPNPGNDLTYIVQTAPGVVMNTDVQGLANFSILGMPGFSYLHTMDGMNDNDNGVNLSMVGPLILLLGQNQIQETTVVTSGYSGQFGGAAGGNINYITKSGGNELHGNAQYYWNGRVLNSNNWFNNAFGEPRPFSIANQWAGSLGGPIRKNKLFFFFDTEGLRLLIPQQFFVTIPSPEFEAATLANIDSKFGSGSASAVFYNRMFNLYNGAPAASSTDPGGFDQEHDPLGCTGFVGPNGLGATVPCARHFIRNRGRPSQDTLTSGRADWNVSPTDRAFLRVQYDRGRAAWVTDPISSLFDVDSANSWWQAQTVETHTFGSSAASQFLLAGSYFEPVFRVKNLSQSLAVFPTTLSFVEGPFNNLGAGANFYGYIGQYQLGGDFFKTARKHKFGLGASLVRIHWNRSPNLANTIGQLNVQTLDAFYQGGLDTDTPDINFTSLSQSFNSQTRLPVSFSNLGFYSGDEWRVRPGLTLSVALRVEHYSNPLCENRCFARLAGPFSSQSHDPNQPYNQAILTNQAKGFDATDNILWSPRLSFAWRPFVRNIVLRGGIGIFYDPLPGLILDSFSNNPPLYNSYNIAGNNLAPTEVTSLFKDAAATNTAFIDGFVSGKTLAQIQAVDANFFPPAISVSEKKTHLPQYQRWSLELEQTLDAGTSVTLGYYGHHGIHALVLNPNANAFGFASLPPGLCTSPPVPPCADARFGGVTQISSNAVSNYGGMVTSFRHRFSRWSQGLFQANYTYGHALDESSGLFTFTSTALISGQDPTNLRGSYGSADHDVRHSFNANYVWEVPVKTALGGRGWDSLVNGWQVSGTIFAHTGFPYTVFDFAQSGSLVSNNYFGLLYAVPAAPLRLGASCGKEAAVSRVTQPCQPPQLLADGTPNPAARFIQANCMTGFNAGHLPSVSGPCDGPLVSFAQGRNRFRGPGYFSTDLSIVKSTKLPGWENGILRIGFQFFNLFNHANFGFPDPGLSSSTFGEILGLEQPPTSILGSGIGANASARMIQLKLELKF
jgi:Carboxypeptidase regulatory-like domain